MDIQLVSKRIHTFRKVCQKAWASYAEDSIRPREAFQKESARLGRWPPHVDRAAILSLTFQPKLVQKSGMNTWLILILVEIVQESSLGRS